MAHPTSESYHGELLLTFTEILTARAGDQGDVTREPSVVQTKHWASSLLRRMHIPLHPALPVWSKFFGATY